MQRIHYVAFLSWHLKAFMLLFIATSVCIRWSRRVPCTSARAGGWVGGSRCQRFTRLPQCVATIRALFEPLFRNHMSLISQLLWYLCVLSPVDVSQSDLVLARPRSCTRLQFQQLCHTHSPGSCFPFL